MAELDAELTDEERRRNSHGPPVLFVNALSATSALVSGVGNGEGDVHLTPVQAGVYIDAHLGSPGGFAAEGAVAWASMKAPAPTEHRPTLLPGVQLPEPTLDPYEMPILSKDALIIRKERARATATVPNDANASLPRAGPSRQAGPDQPAGRMIRAALSRQRSDPSANYVARGGRSLGGGFHVLAEE